MLLLIPLIIVLKKASCYICLGNHDQPYPLEGCLPFSESRREWLLDKFSFEARRTRRAENYKVWKDDNHAIDLSNIDLMEKVNYIHNKPVRAALVDYPEHYIFTVVPEIMMEERVWSK